MREASVTADSAFEKTRGAHGARHCCDFARRAVEDDIHRVIAEVIRAAPGAWAPRVVGARAVGGNDFFHVQIEALRQGVDNLQRGSDVSPHETGRKRVVDAAVRFRVRSNHLADGQIPQPGALDIVRIVWQKGAELGNPFRGDVMPRQGAAGCRLIAGEKIRQGVRRLAAGGKAGASQRQ